VYVIRVAEDHRAVDRAGRRRHPTAREAIVEHLVGGRAVIPHGDLVDPAESRRVDPLGMKATTFD
jgi:hypothetical protein